MIFLLNFPGIRLVSGCKLGERVLPSYVKGSVWMKKILMACCVLMSLTACSWGGTMMDKEYGQDGTMMLPDNSATGTGFAGGTDMDMTGAAAAAAAASVSGQADIAQTVAGWDLMVLHGQYHASQQGKVYPYGDVGFLNYGDDYDHGFEDAKDSIKDVGEDLKSTMDDLW